MRLNWTAIIAIGVIAILAVLVFAFWVDVSVSEEGERRGMPTVALA